jgi:hypothetical protein
LRFSDEQVLKVENVMRAIEFYIWDEKHLQPPQEGE